MILSNTHKKYWLLKWVIAACNKAGDNMDVEMGTCHTPDGDIWDCEDCRYNRYRLEKEVLGIQGPPFVLYNRYCLEKKVMGVV